MFYGILATDGVVLLTDAAHGKPISEQPATEPPEGYVVRDVWVDTGSELVLCHDVVPEEGTPQEAALALSRAQFRSLPDVAAYEFRALAEEYVDGMTCYGEGNAEGMPVTRCRTAGKFFRFIGDGTQVMQPGQNPVDAPSFWAEILPGQDGKVGPWVRPGTDNGFRWKDLGPVEGGDA